MFIFGLAVVVKLLTIQYVNGDKYRELAESRVIEDRPIPANRGNVYSVNGNLLATSIPKYDIRIDTKTPKKKVWQEQIGPLCDSLSSYSGKPSSYYRENLRKAKAKQNRYYLLARDVGYSDYLRLREFPLLNLGAYKGGLIVEQTTKREHPMGGIAQRTIGYERTDENGDVTRPGLDGAFGEKYLKGIDGHRLKQKIGKGQWKPIRDNNEVEPQDGYDIYTTINTNIQDIAHHSLLEQLEKYDADHGCVVVMEVKTGEIRAISNLGKSKSGKYYEKRNYAVWESHEPGSTFKLMAVMAALEDKVIDTSSIVDTKKGYKTFYGRGITDTRGYGKISVGEAFEKSSNIGLATIIDDGYAKNPNKFINRLKKWRLHENLDLPIIGEGDPVIPAPGDKIWSRNALPSMAYGYNMQLTPLQTLTFYNAVANNGEMLKPRFLRQVRELDREIESFEKEVRVKKIASDETIKKAQKLLENVVEFGTGKGMYSKYFSMAGKTGTARTDYRNFEAWKKDRKYVSSFAGYFPVENPKYSCIVVIHKPSIKVGFYGADVTGPVFKRIAQKIFTDTPIIDEIESLEVKNVEVDKEYQNFYNTSNTYLTIMPSVVGLPIMDAVALCENLGLKVKMNGNGVVKSQSIVKGQKVKRNQTIVLELS
ncbi:cell division protein FtsI (penicillin-binding protein 3) [Lacinutrix venerupis]|uniref:penicillin-binding protein n=1 Tax=Lacinutrix venerupis TaxID=1486034 RepID=UPI000EB34676|nr:penicillin-binding protein [Lacinutrix venerupis]RLJ67433.1 cell division protein FtsI (penicillin-binding protein 3) [Lacinutrix venerupis]